jgi:hypothetical protein
MPGDGFRDVTSYLAGGVGSSKDNAGRAEFKAAWEALKARTPPELLAAAYRGMNIRDAD